MYVYYVYIYIYIYCVCVLYMYIMYLTFTPNIFSFLLFSYPTLMTIMGQVRHKCGKQRSKIFN